MRHYASPLILQIFIHEPTSLKPCSRRTDRTKGRRRTRITTCGSRRIRADGSISTSLADERAAAAAAAADASAEGDGYYYFGPSEAPGLSQRRGTAPAIVRGVRRQNEKGEPGRPGKRVLPQPAGRRGRDVGGHRFRNFFISDTVALELSSQQGPVSQNPNKIARLRVVSSSAWTPAGGKEAAGRRNPLRSCSFP